MIREHITAAINDAAAEAGEADQELGPVDDGVTDVDVAELRWIADDMSGPPWPP